MLGGIQNMLAALMGKSMLFGKGVAKGEGKGGEAAAKGAANAEGEIVDPKGRPVGDEGEHLLHGQGFDSKDKHTVRKNAAESTNMKEFLTALKDTTDPQPEVQEQNADADVDAKDGSTDGEAKEAREPREARETDLRREEAKEEGRLQGQQEAKEKEKAETKEAESPEGERQQHDDQDEEDKPGAGWVREEDDSDGDERKDGLRDKGVLTEQNRCKGTLEDGTRCLRKPIQGMAHCREHAVGWRPDVSPKA